MEVKEQQDRVLDPHAAARFWGVSLPTFMRAVKAGSAPPPHYVAPRSPRWLESELADTVRNKSAKKPRRRASASA